MSRMQHASLAAIGRRANIKPQDSLTESFEKRGSKEASLSPPESNSPDIAQPRVLRLDEVLVHLRKVDSHLRALHASRTAPCSTPQPANSSNDQENKESPNKNAISCVACCRQLGEFVRIARGAVNVHINLVRLETLNSSLMDLAQSVDQMVEQEYANVSLGATNLMNAFSRNDRRPSKLASSKTRMSSIRGICEGLRQGLSLIYQTDSLLASEFNDLAVLPNNTRQITLAVVSVLIAASHIVNSGLLLLSQSDLTRYTHTELWEITRGMEELSMLTERVQEQLDEKKQMQLRHLLLDARPFNKSTLGAPLEQRLSEMSLLTDPIDSLRPASVGHIIYLLARYRSSALASILASDLLEVLRGSRDNIDFFTDAFRKEYEFCSNFLDVMTQSTELLRNLRRAQETVDVQLKSILHKNSPVGTVQRRNSRTYRRNVHITKTESVDKFISSFSEKPSKQVKSEVMIEEGDEEGVEKHQKKIVQWSDYYEVTLRHQVVGRYLQLTWVRLSEEMDCLFQVVTPTYLTGTSTIHPPWPLMSKQELQNVISRLRDFGSRDELPTPIRNAFLRQEQRLRIYANKYQISLCQNEEDGVRSLPDGRIVQNIYEELLKNDSFDVEEFSSQLPEDSAKLLANFDLTRDDRTQQISFSHRLLRFHLDQFLRTVDRIISNTVIQLQNVLKSYCTIAAASYVVEYSYKACSRVNLCLSLVELLISTWKYFKHQKSTQETPQTVSEKVSLFFEEGALDVGLVQLDESVTKLKNVLLSMSLAQYPYWKRLVSQWTSTQHICVPAVRRENLEQLFDELIRVLTCIPQKSLSRTDRSSSEINGKETSSPDYESKLACSVIHGVLECLEAGLPANIDASIIARLNSLEPLLARLSISVDQLETSKDVSTDRQHFLTRLESLRNKLKSAGSSGRLSPLPSKSRDAVNRLQQYLSETVLMPLHSSSPFTTLGSLSANVRAYFQNEDVVSRTPTSSRKPPPDPSTSDKGCTS